MNYVKRSILACFLTVTISAPALSSTTPQGEPGPNPRTPATGVKNDNNAPTVPQTPAAVPAGQETSEEMLTLNRPDLPMDLRRLLIHTMIDNPAMSKEQVYAMAARLAQNKTDSFRNWEVIEKEYFNDAQITAFANQVISPDIRERFSKQDVINYFGLNTQRGQLNFIRDYGKGLPEAIASGRLRGAFNAAFLQTRDEINRISEQGVLGDVFSVFNKLVLGQGSGLGILNLQSRGLILLPREIGKLRGINELNLYNNRLIALPPEIEQLAGLKTLILEGNLLTALPPRIGGLKNLQVLYLQNNRLKELPPQMGNLSGLLYLHLEGNRLTSLPASLGNLPNLKEIYLERNSLLNLPDTFYKDKRAKFKINGMDRQNRPQQ